MKPKTRRELIYAVLPASLCGVIGSLIGWTIGSARAGEVFDPDGFGAAMFAMLFHETDIPALLVVTDVACGALLGCVIGVLPYCVYCLCARFSQQRRAAVASREKLRDALENATQSPSQ